MNPRGAGRRDCEDDQNKMYENFKELIELSSPKNSLKWKPRKLPREGNTSNNHNPGLEE